MAVHIIGIPTLSVLKTMVAGTKVAFKIDGV